MSESSPHSCDSSVHSPMEWTLSVLVGHSFVGKGWDLAVTPQHVVAWVCAEENKAVRGSDLNVCLTAVKSRLSLKDTAVAAACVVRGERTTMLGFRLYSRTVALTRYLCVALLVWSVAAPTSQTPLWSVSHRWVDLMDR